MTFRLGDRPMGFDNVSHAQRRPALDTAGNARRRPGRTRPPVTGSCVAGFAGVRPDGPSPRSRPSTSLRFRRRHTGPATGAQFRQVVPTTSPPLLNPPPRVEPYRDGRAVTAIGLCRLGPSSPPLRSMTVRRRPITWVDVPGRPPTPGRVGLRHRAVRPACAAPRTASPTPAKRSRRPARPTSAAPRPPRSRPGGRSTCGARPAAPVARSSARPPLRSSSPWWSSGPPCSTRSTCGGCRQLNSAAGVAP